MKSFNAFLNSGSFFHSFTCDKTRLFLSFITMIMSNRIFKVTSASLFNKPVRGFSEFRILHRFVYIFDEFFFGLFVYFHAIHNSIMQTKIFIVRGK